MSKIIKLKSKEILDSRGNPTISVTCELDGGFIGEAKVPSGKSTGAYEAVELRDGDNSRYDGLGVLNAIKNVNEEIFQAIKEKDFDQKSLDDALIFLDGTQNKARLGANAILGVSMAFAKACAKEKNIELYEYFGELIGNKNFSLPIPCLNIINGGKHAKNEIDIQEYMIAVVGTESFYKKIETAGEVVSTLREILKENNYKTELGDEGGFAPILKSNEEAMQLIEEAIIKFGHSFDSIKICLDVAASSFYDNGFYKLKINGENKNLTSKELIDWYYDIVDKHPIISIEDPFSENDWEGFANITEKLGSKTKIVGDDLTVTNVKRIKTAIDKKAINAVLIKLNQIGTISETIKAIELTKRAGWHTFVSHRSGETLDTTIADLAVGVGAEYIKAGSLTKPERMCKYERLMEIERILNMGYNQDIIN